MVQIVVVLILAGLVLMALKPLLPLLVGGLVAGVLALVVAVLHEIFSKKGTTRTFSPARRASPSFTPSLAIRRTSKRGSGKTIFRKGKQPTKPKPTLSTAQPVKRTKARSAGERQAGHPCPELLEILAPAYPCRHFNGACRAMRWAPKLGHIPRGYCGATGSPAEVELVLVVAEPGDPQAGDHETMEQSIQRTLWAYREGPGLFHRNARKILAYCWPGQSLDQQLRRVWITESVLCSAEVTTGPVPGEVERTCGQQFLLPQLALFPRALVVALGGKAHQRLQRLGIRHERAHAIAPPGCNQKAADPSWRRIAELLPRSRKRN